VRTRGTTAGGCLFAVGFAALFLFFEIVRLVTGHLPEYWEYMLWGYIAISIFGEAYIGLHNAIHDSTAEIKEEIGRLEDKIREEVKRLERE
jgi:hypothetical protein